MDQLAARLFAAVAQEVQPQASEFNAQEFANTAWAFATLGQLDARLLAALAEEVRLQVSEFNAQELANTAWASATPGQLDRDCLPHWLRRCSCR